MVGFNNRSAILFQSTHSRGVRLLTKSPFPDQHDFNPRTHEECDFTFEPVPNVLLDFNPRTHEECDTASAIVCFACWISIHALTRSATGPEEEEQLSLFYFNPRTHEECDIRVPR